jgi:nitroreductase
MELADLLRARHMVRAFEPRPIEPEVLDGVLDAARRAPSAGNSQGWDFVVLEGDDTARFWDVTLPADKRSTFRWQRLLDAPAIVLPLANPRAYLDRYAEPDKAATGLSAAERWPVPYWQVDTSFATMLVLLAAQDAGLGALFFGVFRGADRLLASLGVPDGHQLIGAIALGYPLADEAGRSADRPRRSLADVVHRGGWPSDAAAGSGRSDLGEQVVEGGGGDLAGVVPADVGETGTPPVPER